MARQRELRLRARQLAGGSRRAAASGPPTGAPAAPPRAAAAAGDDRRTRTSSLPCRDRAPRRRSSRTGPRGARPRRRRAAPARAPGRGRRAASARTALRSWPIALAATIPRPTTSPTAIPMRPSPIAHAVVPVAADLQRLHRGPVVGDELEALVARHARRRACSAAGPRRRRAAARRAGRSPARARRDRRDRRGRGGRPGRGAPGVRAVPEEQHAEAVAERAQRQGDGRPAVGGARLERGPPGAARARHELRHVVAIVRLDGGGVGEPGHDHGEEPLHALRDAGHLVERRA